MVKPIAFYLPQYHPIPENSEWWGPGFTEWTNVAKARPNFQGHYQPHVPRDLGFYDLRLPEVMADQIALAKAYGIYGFCFYYYWFSGKKVLERPVDMFFRSNMQFPFCLCWANENWTRRWDGSDNEILLEQSHAIEDDNRFIEDVIPYMLDGRYIRFNGLPLLSVYRPDILTDARTTFADWRKRAKAAGLPGLFIAAVNFWGIDDPRDWGCDALLEFPPHNYLGYHSSLREVPPQQNPEFEGTILDYRKVVARSIVRKHDDFLMFHGCMPSWDNTARRQNKPHIFHHSSPENFEFWLRHQTLKTIADVRNTEKILFINAWNEWGEGCHLEPCQRYQHQHLEAVKRAINPERYLTATPAQDTLLAALASPRDPANQNIDSDLRYLSGLEVEYAAALRELNIFQQELGILRHKLMKLKRGVPEKISREFSRLIRRLKGRR